MTMLGARAYLSGLARAFDEVEATAAESVPLSLDEAVERASSVIAGLRASGRKAMLIGNGGSAGIVSHVHNDLCKAVGVRAVVFTEVPLLTALANDDGYETVFQRQVCLWAEAGDLLIAVSSSGESENILRAAAMARDKGCHLITFTGFKPANRLRQMGDLNVYVPAANYGYVEMTHSILCHCITDLTVSRLPTRA